MRISKGSVVVVALWVGISLGRPAADLFGQKTQKGGAAASATNLVWPGPPAQPRIRFLEAITGVEDVAGKVKLSFVERLSGRSPSRDRLKLRKPYGIAIDQSGRVFVADAEQKGIIVLDRAARNVAFWKGDSQFPLFIPIGLAFSDNGRLYVSDAFGGQIVVFDPSGKPVAAFGKGVLGRPGGLAVDRTRNRLYVADAKLNQVLSFGTADYKQQATIGRPAKATDLEAGALAGPTNLAVNSAGELLVTDTFNCRVQVFDAAGKVLRTFGSQGDRPGCFIRPKGIALDSEGHIYVVDAAFNNFQIFSPDGKPLLFVGSGGPQPGQFLLPAGVTIDREDRIYVTEQRLDGGRLQIFQYLRQLPAKP